MFSLYPNQVDIWLCQPEIVSTYNLDSKYVKMIHPDEHTKVFRYRFEKDQKTSLYARALMRYSLSQYVTATQPHEWQFHTQEKGKLALANNPDNIQFNLSHTKDLIAFAITRQHHLGVDVEYLERQNDIANIAKHYFSEPEITELNTLKKTEHASRFYDYWTLKESYIKALGLGLSIPLRDFSFHINSNKNTTNQHHVNQNIRLSFAPRRNDVPENWKSFLFNLSEKHRGALSLYFPDGAGDANINIRFFNCVPLKKIEAVNLPLDKNI